MIKCDECGKEYSAKGINTHRWRMHGDGQNHDPNQLRKLNDYSVICQFCKNEFNYRNIGIHEKSCRSNPTNIAHCSQCGTTLNGVQKKFCSHSCAAIHSNNEKDYTKIKTGPIAKPKFTEIKWLLCPETGKFYCNRNKKGHVIKHSPYLTDKQRNQYKGNKKLYDYRQQCLFKFDVNDYPDKFNLQLIEDAGWYKPSNRGNNLSGVSRDHMVSIRHGFDNGIDPDIIAHPANCDILHQSKNASKGLQSSITLEELLDRIRNW